MLPHIYHLPDESDAWSAFPAASGRWVFASWLHPRPAGISLSRHGHDIKPSMLLNMGAHHTADECLKAIIDALELPDNKAGPSGTISEISEEVSERWYPVIDASRCTDCGNCLQFCIFNVYEYDDSRRVVAASPDSCKPGCPACSRICPQGAIIFPLYKRDDAIAGAPGMFVSPDAAARRMRYIRAKIPCPVCGQIADPSHTRNWDAAAEVCDECGCPPASHAEPASGLNQDAIDDIDLLINDLENLTRGRS